ncbi:hypothetical protein [Deinococcus hopiensis]|uniref:hypothetical protein n=1 Tax=Deinococcus hopiensis TaxID=309885 RepID=UPI00111C4F8C|nr:hypothetical protein [Deinococcus hopiensis]
MRDSEGPTLWDHLMASLFYQRELSPAMIAAFPYLLQGVGQLDPQDRGTYLADLADAAAQAALNVKEVWWSQLPLEVHAGYDRALQSALKITQEAVVAGAHQRSKRSEEVFAALLSLEAFAQNETRLGVMLARWWPYTESTQPVWALKQYETRTGDVRPLNR